MSKLPNKIRKRLNKEAVEWEISIAKENNHQIQELLDQAEVFNASRPARLPVSLRIDPFDLSMVKRIARKKGVPHTQLIAMWLHERIEIEKNTIYSNTINLNESKFLLQNRPDKKC